MNFLGESCEYMLPHGFRLCTARSCRVMSSDVKPFLLLLFAQLPVQVLQQRLCHKEDGLGLWQLNGNQLLSHQSSLGACSILSNPNFFYNDKLLGVNSRSCSKGIPKSSKGKFWEIYCS